MKKYLFLLLIVSLLFITKNGISQRTPLPTDSAQWVFSGFYHQNTDSVFIYRVKGDTVLGNKTYSKVYKANDRDTNYYSTNETLHCFIRNDTNRRAYIRYPDSYCNDTTEILLYDYNLMAGDTFNVHLFYPRNGLPCFDSVFQFIVSGRNDSVEYFSNYYGTQIQFSGLVNLGEQCWGTGCSVQMDYFLVWDEEYGCLMHPAFYNEYEHCACCGTTLSSGFVAVCFWEKGKWISGPCVIVSINEENQNVPEVNIFPNPVSDISTITLNNNDSKFIKFEVYNLLGEGVYSMAIEGATKTSISINRNDYIAGYYIGKFTDNYGNSVNIKMIIL